jgi:hypothetical protein
MNISTNSMAPSAILRTTAQEADAAQNAITDRAEEENMKQVATFSDDASEAHVAEHIRGLMAAVV